MKSRITVILLAVGLVISCLSATPARAIPAFSRQYKTECKTCHTVIPERNEFGDAFEKNSFVWPGKLPAQAQATPALCCREAGRRGPLQQRLAGPTADFAAGPAQHDLQQRQPDGV